MKLDEMSTSADGKSLETRVRNLEGKQPSKNSQFINDYIGSYKN